MRDSNRKPSATPSGSRDPFEGEDVELVEQLTRDRVGIETMERYCGSSAQDFQPYVLLTNFKAYIDLFVKICGVPLHQGSVMRAAHDPIRRISMIDYSVGSPMAALVVELLSFLEPKAVLMLGMCGGLREEYRVGDFFNPIAAIREEGTSNAYMPPQCPALSSFVIQRRVVQEYEQRKISYHNGVIHTTNVRFWEFNDAFKATLRKERVQAIDMECATLFTVGFARRVPIGALMLISDLPLAHGGIKTAARAHRIFQEYSVLHVEMGMNVFRNMQPDEAAGFGYQF